MRILPLLTLALLVAPSAAWAGSSAPADNNKRAACFRTIPGDTNRAARTIRVPCTPRSIPPVFDPTPFFLL